ncbi:four helix bundle protein [Flavobacterium sp. NST-5]|uniref:Four helix bundle protein n=1 Tax=Flavobacterium ichthyis TaxID=2698827 RepID=A0ABW9Z6Z0_9FLAO|nr:four helix bundle protein [Flavobacterium ichthyis]NBL64637.1 four helix bundle protein [Flavobacterium ichthyis]
MDYKDLLAYKKSFVLAMMIFDVSKNFPKEEKYSLTDQIRRSSRSVTVTITESYRKRVYPKNFLSKLTDAEAENSETQVWLDFSLSCGYLEESKHIELTSLNNEVGKLIYYMIKNPEKFGSTKV